MVIAGGLDCSDRNCWGSRAGVVFGAVRDRHTIPEIFALRRLFVKGVSQSLNNWQHMWNICKV